MIFENLHTFSMGICVILLLLGVYYFFITKNKNNSLISYIFLFISLFFLIISIFSPRIGTYDILSEQEGGNVLFVMDVSKSMNVYDMNKGMNKISRGELQKEFIQKYTEQNSQNNYSLFAFAGETVEILPFTSDIGLFHTILNGVDQNNVSVYGSDFENLFTLLGDYLEKEDYSGTVVIITDGGEIENTEIQQSIIDKINLHDSNILIAGIGTEKGDYIIEGQDIFGRSLYKKYNNQRVLSNINSTGIKEFTDRYNFQSVYINKETNFDIFSHSIDSLVDKYLIEKNISLSRDISYIFIIFFSIFFTLFLYTENKNNINLGKK